MVGFLRDNPVLSVFLRRQLRRAAYGLWQLPPLRGLSLRLIRIHTRLDAAMRLGRWPDHPDELYNDYLLRLKLSAELDTPLRRRITDKALSKDFIAERLGPGRSVPTLALLDTAQDIAAFRPPAYPVAVKPTHSSARLLRIGSEAEWIAAEPTLVGWLHHDYFRQSLERNYAGLARRIIVEPWLDETLALEGSVHFREGVPKVVSIVQRYTKARQSYLPDRSPLGVSLVFPLVDFQLESWAFFDPLLADATRLAQGFSSLRVDFYTDCSRIVFGELTTITAAGVTTFHPANGEAIFSRVFFAPPP
jgi:TupA-like ATPgrasp